MLLVYTEIIIATLIIYLGQCIFWNLQGGPVRKQVAEYWYSIFGIMVTSDRPKVFFAEYSVSVKPNSMCRISVSAKC